MSVQGDPLVGRRFGSWLVERLIGSGGMGTVYAAVQPEIGKRVAIKFLMPELASDPQVVQRFFAEARAVNLIQHENIVDVLDFRVLDGFSFIVMELLTGRSLADELAALGRLPVRRALEIAVQVAAAIAAAHTHDIFHRDLKPDNIFLTPKAGYPDFVKVLDFGIAKLRRPLGGAAQTVAGVVMGTPGFMAPEQIVAGAVDGRADIYALGVILYRMLEGRLPFSGDSMEAVLRGQLQRRPPPLQRSDVEAPLAELVLQMLQREPERRPQAMRGVQERLVAALRTASAGAPTPSSGQLRPVSGGWRSVPPTMLSPAALAKRRALASRPRWPLVAAGGFVLALAAVAGGARWYARRGAAPTTPTPAPTREPTPAEPREPPNPPTVAPAPRGFQVFLETRPEGAEIWAGDRLLGTTPVRIGFEAPRAVRLHKRGYVDETIDVGPDHEHVFTSLRRAPEPRRPGGFGLND